MQWEYLAGAAGAFAQHLVVGLAFLVLFIVAYTRITPHRELELIRAGNGAAALGLMGAAIGFAIPLSTAIGISGSIVEAAVWALIALLAQLLAVGVARLALPRLFMAIGEGDWASALTKAGAAISVGLINAACMTP
jgi:putative membrane protein